MESISQQPADDFYENWTLGPTSGAANRSITNLQDDLAELQTIHKPFALSQRPRQQQLHNGLPAGPHHALGPRRNFQGIEQDLEMEEAWEYQNGAAQEAGHADQHHSEIGLGKRRRGPSSLPDSIRSRGSIKEEEGDPHPSADPDWEPGQEDSPPPQRPNR